MGSFFDQEIKRFFAPYKEMANMARNWFEEEKERVKERKIEEDKWRKEYEASEEKATKERREKNKKDAAAQ